MSILELEQIKAELEEIKHTIEELKEHFNISSIREEISDLEKKTLETNFWNDKENSQKVLQKIKILKNRKEKYEKLISKYEDLETLIEIALEENDESVVEEIKSEFESLKETTYKLKLGTLLTGEYDSNNAIINLHAGAGGTEAQDWVEMLYRMYTRWAERNGFIVKTLDLLNGEEAGIKSVTLHIIGENAYGFLKSEKGVHRLVRISPFDASGRRHTSFASLDVMPELNDDIEVEINPDDLRIDTYRSGGAGGQHVNKTSSAVRITHLPTGIVVSCQNERSQHQNKETAMKILKAKLLELKEREQQEKIEGLKGEQMDIAWGSQIRSYVFCPYTLVKDHRTNYEEGNVNKVMDGDIDAFINAYLLKNKQ